MMLPVALLLAASVAAERAHMVHAIRHDLHRLAADADTPALRRVLRVMAKVPRDRFVVADARPQAYQQMPLPIGHDQTISDPYIVALMTAAAAVPANGTVLDVGTGSGYQAAVLAGLARRVYSVELVPELARSAGTRLATLGYGTVTVRAGDGYAGWPEHAPFDAIIVAAGAADVPRPLIAQLRPGGRLVMPIGTSWTNEHIIVLTKGTAGTVTRCSLGWSMFVPLKGLGERQGAGADPQGRKTTPLCYQAEVARPDFRPLGSSDRQASAMSRAAPPSPRERLP